MAKDKASGVNVLQWERRVSDIEVVPFSSTNSTLAIFLGYERGCAILSDRSLKCWTSLREEQAKLSLPFVESVLSPTELGDDLGDAPGEMGLNLPALDFGGGQAAVQITLRDYPCALFRSGEIKCWGNVAASDGNATTTFRNFGDEAGEMQSLPTLRLP